jgi:hypothetical protein
LVGKGSKGDKKSLKKNTERKRTFYGLGLLEWFAAGGFGVNQTQRVKRFPESSMNLQAADLRGIL